MAERRTLHRSATRPLLGLVTVALLSQCKGTTGDPGEVGASGDPGKPGPTPNSTVLAPQQDLPGLVTTILGLSGGTGPNGNFLPGDRFKVRFFVARKTDGRRIAVNELNGGYALVSGPTQHFQRVFSLRADVLTRAVVDPENPDSLVYTYAFNTPFPEVYLAPMNDSPDLTQGEWTGQPIKDGTYTLGMHFWKDYTIEGAVSRDPANLTRDFLVGSATELEPHEVVKTENCNQCHIRLHCHGGLRYDVKLCAMCHHEGAEDSLDRSITPRKTVDFKVLIHALHNGAHLPSVLGVATGLDGGRDYAAPPRPNVVYREFSDHFSAEVGGVLRDFSSLRFPVMPAATSPRPRNQGYASLTAEAKAKDDLLRTGVTACEACHGDPDGPGPATAPLQGSAASDRPSRAACGSCHDDIDWTRPYTKNGQTQPPQADDSKCLECHPATGAALAADVVHLHPLNNPALNPGINLSISSISEAGTNDGNGALDPGEGISVTFTVKDDSGAEVPRSALASLLLVVTGPTTNRNLVHYVTVPPAAVTGATQPYTLVVPAFVPLDPVGTSARGTTAEDFTTSRVPHLAVAGGATTVQVRTADSPGTVLSAPARAAQSYLDVADAAGAGIGRNAVVVLDDGVASREEYVRVQHVENNTRLWLSAPGDTTFGPWLRNDHPAGAELKKVTLAPKLRAPNPDGGAAHYTLAPATGTITELGDSFNTGSDGGEVLATYWADFVMPRLYPPALNDSPGLDETWGKWTGKPLADGTYTLGLWGSRVVQVNEYGESNRYTSGAVAATRDFLFGSATALVPWGLISGPTGATCNACHRDLQAHGGSRRGLGTCLLCHANSGGEDRPRYVAPNAPATPGLTINFRTMLHKIHMGKALANASTYRVVGYGSRLYPDNFSLNGFEDVAFPPTPGKVKHCAKCHGDKNSAWQQPANRDHPTQQGAPVRGWSAVCGSCHDSSAAASHFNLETFQGSEACAVCHGPNRSQAVDVVHKVR